MQLDVRARSAAAALQDAVADRTVPTRAPAPKLRAIVAIAALLLLVATGVVLFTREDDTRVSSGGAVPRFVVDPVPAGLTATGAVDLPLDTAPDTIADIAVYANDVDPPFAMLMVVHGTFEPGSPAPEQTVQVQGHDAVLEQTDTQTQVVWNITPTERVVLAARGIDQDELLAAAETVDAASLTVERPPLGLPLAGRVLHEGFQGDAVLAPVGAVGHIVDYEQGAARLTVAMVEGNDDVLTVVRYFTIVTAQHVVVRGHDALIGSPFDSPDGVVVLWQESPGVVAMVSGRGMTRDEVLDALSRLRDATDQEWEALKALTPTSSGGS